MAIKLSESVQSGPKVGSSVFITTSNESLSQPVLDIDGKQYLRSGNLLLNERTAYPEVFSLVDRYSLVLPSNYGSSFTSRKLRSVVKVRDGLVASFAGFNGSSWVYHALKSYDNGLTWVLKSWSWLVNDRTYASDGLDAVVTVFNDGTSNRIVVSTNAGETWTLKSLSGGGGVLQNVVYANGEFVTLGGTTSNAASPKLGRSVDGLNWTETTVAPGPLELTFSNGKWYRYQAGQPILVSTDLVTWTQLSSKILSTNTRLFFDSGTALYAGNNTELIRSTDGGVNWEVVLSGNFLQSNMVLDDGELWVNSSSGLYKSTDGATFELVYAQSSGGLYRSADKFSILYADNATDRISSIIYDDAVGFPYYESKYLNRSVKYLRIK